jgi:hypothetical protein
MTNKCRMITAIITALLLAHVIAKIYQYRFDYCQLASGGGFTSIPNVQDLTKNDIVTVRYVSNRDRGNVTTCYTATIMSNPIKATTSSDVYQRVPSLYGTIQWLALTNYRIMQHRCDNNTRGEVSDYVFGYNSLSIFTHANNGSLAGVYWGSFDRGRYCKEACEIRMSRKLYDRLPW